MALWGGRFEEGADPLFRAINDSLPIDWRLAEHDIDGSIAWADAIAKAGVLTADESARIRAALEEIRDIARTLAAPPIESGAEDVHTWVEDRLVERVGDLGKKLHTGRSRNDQVATDLRLFVRAALKERRREIRAAQEALLDLAERELDTIFPGYTHLQRAQPVRFAHWCMAYVEMLERDADRFREAGARADRCPLGAAALAGTTYPIDRLALAQALGFSGPTGNSLDAVSDRDFAVDAVAAAALCATHLSKIAEDLIIYNSAEFGFVEMSDAVASGSSLMPQKKNPDALELLRGKCGRVLGAHVSLVTTLKGLPLAYNKDLQEDKAPLYDAMDALSLCMRALALVAGGLRVDRERCAEAAKGGHSNATELADYLVEKGVPFRTAHEQAGRLVRAAIDRGVGLEELTLDELRAEAPELDEGVYPRLTLESCVERRAVPGGTARDAVARSIAQARKRLDAAKGVLKTNGPKRTAGLSVRPAHLADVERICGLVNHWADQNMTMRRYPAEVAFSIRDFYVATQGGEITACGALRFVEGRMAEICSIAVGPDAQGAGVGRALVRRLKDEAIELGVAKVFLASSTRDFFERCGFTVVERSSIPEEAWTHPVLKTPRNADVVMTWTPPM